ncbi:hypothetical protein JCM13580A_62410 [Streptomyces drozdowiczii]
MDQQEIAEQLRRAAEEQERAGRPPSRLRNALPVVPARTCIRPVQGPWASANLRRPTPLPEGGGAVSLQPQRETRAHTFLQVLRQHLWGNSPELCGGRESDPAIREESFH